MEEVEERVEEVVEDIGTKKKAREGDGSVDESRGGPRMHCNKEGVVHFEQSFVGPSVKPPEGRGYRGAGLQTVNNRTPASPWQR